MAAAQTRGLCKAGLKTRLNVDPPTSIRPGGSLIASELVQYDRGGPAVCANFEGQLGVDDLIEEVAGARGKHLYRRLSRWYSSYREDRVVSVRILRILRVHVWQPWQSGR